METYGMPAPDDPAIDVYQQYISQTSYRCERPEDGDHTRMEPRECDDYRRQEQYPERPSGYQDAASYGGAGYRLPWRQSTETRRRNSRNGLYSPTELRAGGGDSFNSLPGLGNYERPRRRRHIWE